MIVGGRAHITAVSTWRRSPPSRTTRRSASSPSAWLPRAARHGRRHRHPQASDKPFTPCVEIIAHGNPLDSDDRRSVLDRRLPAQALLLGGLPPGQHPPPRDERGPPELP